MTEPTKHEKVTLYHDYAGMVDCQTGERVTCAPMTYVGFADYEALHRELAEARGENERLNDALGRLLRDLEAERENHAQLQARCYEGFPSASDGIFDWLRKVERDLEAARGERDAAYERGVNEGMLRVVRDPTDGCPIVDGHRWPGLELSDEAIAAGALALWEGAPKDGSTGPVTYHRISARECYQAIFAALYKSQPTPQAGEEDGGPQAGAAKRSRCELDNLTPADREMIDAVIDGHYERHGSAVKGDLHGSLYAAGKMSALQSRPASEGDGFVRVPVSLIERLRQWNAKWPKGRVFSYGEHKDCEQELDEIVEALCGAHSPASEGETHPWKDALEGTILAMSSEIGQMEEALRAASKLLAKANREQSYSVQELDDTRQLVHRALFERAAAPKEGA